jgi:hypothetical protein
MNGRCDIAEVGATFREMPIVGRATSPGRLTVLARGRLHSSPELTGRGSVSGSCARMAAVRQEVPAMPSAATAIVPRAALKMARLVAERIRLPFILDSSFVCVGQPI